MFEEPSKHTKKQQTNKLPAQFSDKQKIGKKIYRSKLMGQDSNCKNITALLCLLIYPNSQRKLGTERPLKTSHLMKPANITIVYSYDTWQV